MTSRIILISVFGVIGVLSRYFLDLFMRAKTTSSFPLSIFIVNVLGCAIAGVFFALFQNKNFLNEDLRVAIFVGLLGGFTTFSAFSLDLLKLSLSSQYSQAMLYAMLSVIVSFAATIGAYIVTSQILLSKFFT